MVSWTAPPIFSPCMSHKIGALKVNDPDGRFRDLPGTPEEADALIMERRRSDYDANKAMLERGAMRAPFPFWCRLRPRSRRGRVH